jgi:hypothetical protein
MMKLSTIAIASVLIGSGFAAPTFAASSSTPTLAAGQTPSCSSSTAERELKDGVYADQLRSNGTNIDSIELWNGCVRVVYSDASGTSGMAFYDPDTLQLLQKTQDTAPTFG